MGLSWNFELETELEKLERIPTKDEVTLKKIESIKEKIILRDTRMQEVSTSYTY